MSNPAAFTYYLHLFDGEKQFLGESTIESATALTESELDARYSAMHDEQSDEFWPAKIRWIAWADKPWEDGEGPQPRRIPPVDSTAAVHVYYLRLFDRQKQFIREVCIKRATPRTEKELVELYDKRHEELQDLLYPSKIGWIEWGDKPWADELAERQAKKRESDWPFDA